MRTANRHKNHPAVILIKYEDLIQFPEKTIQRVCDHLGIKYNQNMLDIPVTGAHPVENATLERRFPPQYRFESSTQ